MRLQDVAFSILEEYSDRQHITDALVNYERQAQFPQRWMPFSLPFGDAGVGVALGYAHRLQPTQGWDRIAHH